MTPPGQARQLARTFFARMFESDVMPAGVPQTQLLFSTIAFLAAPGLALPILLAKKYIGAPPAIVHAGMTQDRALVLLLAMLATAIVTLVLWEKVFPDRRDCRTLGVLPIAPSTFVRARLAALVGLFALLFVTSTAVWSVVLGVVHGLFGAPGGMLRNVVAHFVALTTLEAAVFFGILGVQCAIVVTVGTAAAHRVAVVLQVLLVVLTLQLPLLLPSREAFALGSAAAPPWTDPAILWPLPSMWFLALLEAVAWGGYAQTRATALVALAAGALLPPLALAFYAASYRRLTRLAIEGRPVAATRERTSVLRRFIGIWMRLAAAPAGTAVGAFTVRTLARSQQHRMLLSIWIGIAIALIVSTLLPVVVRWDPHGLEQPPAAVLVVPFILMTLVLTGMRMLFALPSEIKANWSFRLYEPTDTRGAVEGGAIAMGLCGVLPACSIALVSAAWLWGAAVGVKHALFTAALGMLLVQALMRGLDKIPFTCTYVPGKAQVTNFWPAYLLAFAAVTGGMATLEASVLRSTAPWAIATLTLGASGAVLWLARRRDLARRPGLRFQEEPDEALTVLRFQ